MLNEIKKYVAENSWFDLDESIDGVIEYDGFLEFSTRRHGNVGNESFGVEDFREARRLATEIAKNFKVKIKLETVDEWTLMTVMPKEDA